MQRPSPADCTDVVAVSYNIHKGVGTDGRRQPERILDVLDEVGADIAVLQEADLRFGVRHGVLPGELLAARGLRALPFDRRGISLGWHGNAVLVRAGVEALRHRRIRLPALEPRGAVLADLAVNGRVLRVAGMHLDLSGLRRHRQILSVLQRLAAAPGDPPALVMGDLNEWREGAEPLRVLAAGFAPVPTGPTFPARLPVGRLDRIFASRQLTVLDSGVHASALARMASDHLPVWVRLRLPG
ncbi:MAG: endonuclease/exonuclease/phosphatase family protein [Sphingomonadaceae bacterium]